MEPSNIQAEPLAETSKRFARRLLTIGGNRIELLMVELQEERVRLLQAILLALGVGALGLLAGLLFSGAIVLLLWNFSPMAVLLGLGSLYAAAAGWFYARLTRLLRDWENLPATVEQLRKDCACWERHLT
jgi:uncharacterized membrane protein YqjE